MGLSLLTCGRLLSLNVIIFVATGTLCLLRCVSSNKSNNIILAADRNAFDWMYTTPAVLPYGFHVSITINVSLNISWLFLFDRE